MAERPFAGMKNLKIRPITILLLVVAALGGAWLTTSPDREAIT